MRKILATTSYILIKMCALFCGMFTGAALAVAIVEGSLSALIKSIWISVPLKPGEASDTWMLEWEWKIAAIYALLITGVATILWGLAAWRRLASCMTAMILGFVLSTMAAALQFADADMEISTLFIQCLLIGCAGAAAGVVTFCVDQALQRRRARL